MTKKTLFISILLIGLCVICILEIIAGQLQEDKDQLNPLVENIKKTIGRWDILDVAFIVLSIIISSLGIVASNLKQIKISKSKALFWLGVIIGIFTLINNFFVKGNYHERAVAGSEILNKIRFMMIHGYTPGNEAAREEWLSQIQASFNKFEMLKRSSIPPTVAEANTIGSFHWASSAFAQTPETKLPPWVSKPSSDVYSLRFVGVGENAAAEKAIEFSINKAKSEASEYLAYKFNARMPKNVRNLDARILANFLLKSGKTEDSYRYFDDKLNLFRCYTLFVLNKNTLNTDMKFFSIQNKVQVPRTLEIPGQEQIESKGKALYLRIEQQEKNLNAARIQFSVSDYEDYLKAQQARITGNAKESLQILERIVQKKPDFYLGWHELALTYDALQDVAKAEQAYQKAKGLSSPSQNSDLYIAYADFLIRQGKTNEAYRILQDAIPNNPDNARVRQMLMDIK